MSDHFCRSDTPQDLAVVLHDVNKTRDWCKAATVEQLINGLNCVHLHHQALRSIIQDELTIRQHKELSEHLSALRKPHWTLVPTFWIVVIGTIAAILSVFIGWLSMPKSVTGPLSSPTPVPLPLSAVVVPSATSTPKNPQVQIPPISSPTPSPSSSPTPSKKQKNDTEQDAAANP